MQKRFGDACSGVSQSLGHWSTLCGSSLTLRLKVRGRPFSIHFCVASTSTGPNPAGLSHVILEPCLWGEERKKEEKGEEQREEEQGEDGSCRCHALGPRQGDSGRQRPWREGVATRLSRPSLLLSGELASVCGASCMLEAGLLEAPGEKW